VVRRHRRRRRRRRTLRAALLNLRGAGAGSRETRRLPRARANHLADVRRTRRYRRIIRTVRRAVHRRHHGRAPTFQRRRRVASRLDRGRRDEGGTRRRGTRERTDARAQTNGRAGGGRRRGGIGRGRTRVWVRAVANSRRRSDEGRIAIVRPIVRPIARAIARAPRGFGIRPERVLVVEISVLVAVVVVAVLVGILVASLHRAHGVEHASRGRGRWIRVASGRRASHAHLGTIRDVFVPVFGGGSRRVSVVKDAHVLEEREHGAWRPRGDLVVVEEMSAAHSPVSREALARASNVCARGGDALRRSKHPDDGNTLNRRHQIAQQSSLGQFRAQRRERTGERVVRQQTHRV